MVRTEPDYHECDTSPSDGQPVWQLLPSKRRLGLLRRLLRLLRLLRLRAGRASGGHSPRTVGAAPFTCPASTAARATAPRASRAGCGMCHRTAGTAGSRRFLPILRSTTRRLLTAFLHVIGSVTGQDTQPGRCGGSRSGPAARSKCTFPPYPSRGQRERSSSRCRPDSSRLDRLRAG